MIRTLLASSKSPRLLPKFSGRTLTVLILFLIGYSEVRAQLAYTVEQLPGSAFAFPLPGRTVLNAGYALGTPVDNAVYAVPIPFTFNFNGVGYASLNMSTNGFVTFGGAASVTNTTPISSVETYTGAISVYGADLGATNNVLDNNLGYLAEGAPGNQILKLEWIVRRKDNNGVLEISPMFIFQLWLYEGSNVVEMRYHTFSPPAWTVMGQIGLRGSNNSQFKNLWHVTSADWPSGAGMPLGTVNTDAVRTRSSARILTGSNRLFRWIPESCFAPPSVTASSVTGNSAVLNWTAASPAPANGYQYYYTTSAILPTGSTTPSGNTLVGVQNTSLSGLTSSSTYYAYVRSDCGSGDYSPWVAVSFNTLCPPQNIPYFQYFDPGQPGYSYTLPAIPPCSSIQNLGAGNNWVTAPFSAPDEFYDEHLVYNAHGSQPANVWYYTQGVNLVAGEEYMLSYMYGGSTEFAFLTNKMEVRYGNFPNAASMTTAIADHPMIKASPINNIVNFTAPSTGTFYFGFRAYSDANMGRLFLDNIEIMESFCIKPENLAVQNVTGTSALLTWDVPAPAPANGYAYYVTTTNTPPLNNTVPSGYTSAGTNIHSLTGLSTNTTYYVWVRGHCGSGNFSQWSDSVTFTTLNPPVYTYCTPAPYSFDGQGIVNITVGSINNSTGLEAGNYGNYSSLITNVAQNSTVNVAITYNTGYSYYTRIWVDWNNDSDFADVGEMVYYGESNNAAPTTLNASFIVPAGASLGEHRMRIGGTDFDTLAGTGAGQGPCYNGAWGAFEDYTVNVVVPPPPLSLNITSDVQCAGSPSNLVMITSALTNYTTYTWSPSTGVSGDAVSGYIFNPNTTLTYTLTAIQTAFPFSTNTVNFTYNANALPTPIVIAPAVPQTCLNGPAVQLSASGGIVSGIAVLSENFNGSATGWTTTNASTGGSIAAPAWTLRPNGFNPAGATGISSISSNDATQFYLTNSDAQGSGSNTNVTLTSPLFDLTGYTDASLSFYHYYKPWINGQARVEIFSGGSWNVVPILSWGNTGSGTVEQGTPTNFAHVVYNLGAYAGQSNLRIRFNYTASWGYLWAIDNFLISGSATSTITWTPATGLFTDAAATSPYTGSGTATVYALPTATTTYTASASTPSPICTTSTNVTVTITSISAGSVSPTNQSACGAAAPLILSGASGTVTQWQYATNSAFTVGVTNIPASASTTLSSAQIGSFSGIRYYRALVSSAGCIGYSNIVSVDYSAATTWTGTWSNGVPDSNKKVIFNANFSSTSNLDACSVEVMSGNVTINSGHVLHVQNEVIRTGGSLTFENDASLVQVNNSAVNSGSITYKRNSTSMRQYDFTYWSSPLTAQALIDFSPDTMADKYYTFNAATNSFVVAVPASSMQPGKGYAIRAPDNYTSTPQIFTGIFNSGAANNGVIPMSIQKVGANDMNLIGNPYPSALDADLFLSHPSNATMLGGTLYFWTHNTPITVSQYSGSDYAIYNFMGGVGTAPATNPGVNNNIPTRFIAAGQGFFARAIATGAAITNNSMRVSGNNGGFFRNAETSTTPQDMHRVWLEMTNTAGAYKQILVGYASDATNEMDRKYDGLTAEAGNVISFYSLLEQSPLAIQGRAMPFNESDQVPLGYRSDFQGNFSVRLSDFDGLFNNLDIGIYLEDKLLNIIHDLRASDYDFTTDAGIFNQRFVLRYSDLSLGNPDFELNESEIVVFKNTDGLHINAGSQVIRDVMIYDIRGRYLAAKRAVNFSEASFDNLPITQQVLLVRIITVDGAMTVRKVIF